MTVAIKADGFVGVGDLVNERITWEVAADISIFALYSCQLAGLLIQGTSSSLLGRKGLSETKGNRDIHFWTIE